MVLTDQFNQLGFGNPSNGLYQEWWNWGKSNYGDVWTDENTQMMKQFFDYKQKKGDSLTNYQRAFIG